MIIVQKSRTAGEVVGALLDTSYTCIKSCIASVLGVENTVLEALWVMEIDVKLAILAVLCRSDTRTNRRDI